MKPKFQFEFQKGEVLGKRIENQYIDLMINGLFQNKIDGGNHGYYKLHFPRGCGSDLMIHKTGVLQGLKTTSIIENGKIMATAGLESVSVPESKAYTLLRLTLYGMVLDSLSYIAELSSRLYQLKVYETKAKFDRITYIVKSSFEILPVLIDDEQLRASYLNQILGCNNDCYELFVLFGEQFKDRCKEAGNKINQNNTSHLKRNEILRELLGDNVFGAFERFLAGKICEIFISNNFTEKYLKSAKSQIDEMSQQLVDIYSSANWSEKTFRNNWQSQINSKEVNKQEYDNLQNELNKYMQQNDSIKNELIESIKLKKNVIQLLICKTSEQEVNFYLKDSGLYSEEYTAQEDTDNQ